MTTIATINPATIEDYEISIESPYNSDFLSDLKDKIDWRSRKFCRTTKRWNITEAEAALAISIANEYYEVIDARTMSTYDIDDAKMDAEIARIEAAQMFVRERQEWISARITELDAELERYSFRSKSSVKATKAKDRYLLVHALENAQMSIEKMTEVQVRGLLSAARRIEEGDI